MSAQIDSQNCFPFKQYLLVETKNIDALNAAVSREIGDHDFSFPRRPHPCSSRVSCVRLSKTRLFGVNFGAALKARTPPAKGLQLVLPLTGSLVKHDGQKTYRARYGQGFFTLPETPINVDWGRNSMAVVIWVDSLKLSNMLQSPMGGIRYSQLQFPDLIDLQRGTGLSISNLVRTIMLELNDDSSLFSRGIISKSIEDNLLLSILHATINAPFDEKLWWDGNKTLRMAIDYIHAHLQDDISLLDLAHVTGVSVRKLQYDFTRAFGVGPMTLIRREKLKRINKELKEARIDGTSIAEIAARWSFFDRGYLTRIYKKEFGETPSDTCRCRPYF